MGKLKTICLKLGCFILLICCVCLTSCNNVTQDAGDDILAHPSPYSAKNTQEFLDDWYQVQIGKYENFKNVEGYPDVHNSVMQVKSFYDLPFVIIPTMKSEIHTISRIIASPNSYTFQYKNKHDSTEDLQFVFFKMSLSQHGYDNESLTYFNGKFFCKNLNSWNFDLHDYHITIYFPEALDASDPAIIHEYFDFDTISVLEYESMMME